MNPGPAPDDTGCRILHVDMDAFYASVEIRDQPELAGRPVVPVMLGGDLRHSLAVEVSLKPVLVEIGASCPTRGLFLVDADYENPAVLDEWATLAVPQVAAAVHGRPSP